MKFFKLLSIALSTGIVSFGLTNQAFAEEVLRLSHNTANTGSWHTSAEKFAASIKKVTDGKYSLRVFSNASLSGGDQMKQAEMVGRGAIDFVMTSAINVTPIVPEMAVFSLPYLYTDYKQVDATTAGEPGKKMVDIMAKHDIIVLAWGENGFREVTNNVRPIKAPSDMKGLKMRVAGPMYIDVMNSLGANPQQMQWTETFSALQQGVVDGQENPIGAVIIPQRVYEVQKYLTTWHYSYDPIFIGVSKKRWTSFDEATKAKVRDAAKEAMAFQVEMTRKVTADGLTFLREKGMLIHESTAEELQQFRTATKPAFDLWAAKVGPDLVKVFQDSIATAK